VPAFVMIVVIGIPDDPAFAEIGKMLLGEPGEGVDERTTNLQIGIWSRCPDYARLCMGSVP
jgi:hypothetical protein